MHFLFETYLFLEITPNYRHSLIRARFLACSIFQAWRTILDQLWPFEAFLLLETSQNVRNSLSLWYETISYLVDAYFISLLTNFSGNCLEKPFYLENLVIRELTLEKQPCKQKTMSFEVSSLRELNYYVHCLPLRWLNLRKPLSLSSFPQMCQITVSSTFELLNVEG